MEEKKYQFNYGPAERKYFNQAEAIQDMKEFMEHLKKNPPVLETTWHLYLNNNEWNVVAGSVVTEHGQGEFIQEFKVEE